MASLKRSLINVGELGLLIVLGGVACGAAFAVYFLSEFSPLPRFFAFFIPLVSGVCSGALTRNMGHSLVAVIGVSLLGIGVTVVALSYPELRGDHLGLEIITSISLPRAIRSGFFFVFPLMLIGVLLGKLLFRE